MLMFTLLLVIQLSVFIVKGIQSLRFLPHLPYSFRCNTQILILYIIQIDFALQKFEYTLTIRKNVHRQPVYHRAKIKRQTTTHTQIHT